MFRRVRPTIDLPKPWSHFPSAALGHQQLRSERLVWCDLLSGDDWNQLSDHNPVIALFR